MGKGVDPTHFVSAIQVAGLWPKHQSTNENQRDGEVDLDDFATFAANYTGAM